MIVKLCPGALRQTRWYEYFIRFLFGGCVTAAAGLIAHRFGPAVGGLFLAFPAIFPASATLIEKHQREKKAACGFDGRKRGRDAAALEAVGSALGSVGLFCFALLLSLLLPRQARFLALAGATAVWGFISFGLWILLRRS